MVIKIIDILSEAFSSNNSVNYATDGSQKRRRALVRYCYQQALQKGRIYNIENTAALVIYKDRKGNFLKDLFSSVYLIIQGLQFKTFKIIKKEARIREIHRYYDIPSNGVYLWYIGTLRANQGKGHGTRLLRRIISEHSEQEIVLETSVQRNIAWYKKHGFENYHIEDIGGITLYFFRRASLA